jgi:hypothetical protein
VRVPGRSRRLRTGIAITAALAIAGVCVVVVRRYGRRLDVKAALCADSIVAARGIALRITGRVMALRPRFPTIAELDPATAVNIGTAAEIEDAGSVEGDGPVVGSLLFARGESPDTSHCGTMALCDRRWRFAPGGVYVWLDFRVRPYLSQTRHETTAIGPLDVTMVVQGAGDVSPLHAAVAEAVALEQRDYEALCGHPP